MPKTFVQTSLYCYLYSQAWMQQWANH